MINASTTAINMFSITSTVVGGSGRMFTGSGPDDSRRTNRGVGTPGVPIACPDDLRRGSGRARSRSTCLRPKDGSGGARAQVLDPTTMLGNRPSCFPVLWLATTPTSGHQSGSGITCIQTNGGSTAGFPTPPGCGCPLRPFEGSQNRGSAILIPLPTLNGSTGLTPLGESQAGWWKIEYTVGGGSDLTTWELTSSATRSTLVVP